MLRIFLDNLLPVFLVAGAGYALAARTRLDPRPVNQVAFSILAPVFVFQVINASHVTGGAFLKMAGFGAAVMIGVGGAVALIGRALRWPRTLTAAAVLVTMIPNNGNYGLSASLFAFGEAGLAQASLFFVVSSMLTFTAGVLVASLGRAGIGEALAGLWRVPAVWAVAIAFLMRGFGVELPRPAARATELLAGACVPVFLLILGMQLRASVVRAPRGALTVAVAARLAGGAALGLAMAPVFGLEGVARQAGVFQAAMPTAVVTTILAGRYELEPDFVSAAVLASTLLTPFTLTPLLALLGA